MISPTEDVWGKQPRFSDFQFTVLTLCSCLRISSAIVLQLEELYSYDKVHKQSSGNSFTCQLLQTGLFGFIASSPTCFQPTDTTTAQTFNPVTQVRACQAGFLVLLRFLENVFIFTALWFCQQANACHETVFPVSFFSQRKGGKKAISQQTYLLCGTTEKFQNRGQNCSLLLHKGLKEYTGDVLYKFSSRRWPAFM